MKKPIDIMMDAVAWEPTGLTGGDGLPYATHSGVLHIMDKSLRCYRLNTGQAIIHADDMNALFADWTIDDTTEREAG